MDGGEKDSSAKGLQRIDHLVEAEPGQGYSRNCWRWRSLRHHRNYFQNVTGTKFQFVPYRGGAPLYQDLAASHIDLALGMAAGTYPLVRSGQIKAYAMMAKTRWWAAPDVPTMEEAGVPGLYASFWHGLWVPKGTSENVIASLNSAVRSALADPAVRQRFADQGQAIPAPEQQSPEALGAHQRAEIKKWWPVIKAAGIKAY